MKAKYIIEIESDSHINVACASKIFEEYFLEFREELALDVKVRDRVRYED